MKSRVRVALVLLLILLVAGLFGRPLLIGPPGDASRYLLLEVGGAYAEAAPAGLLGRVFRRREHTLLELLATLKSAAKDDRIRGLVVRVTKLQIGWAKAQDIRAALGDFKAGGKPVIAYLEHEAGAGNLEYYVASAATEVYLPPNASAPLTGLLSQFFFFGGVWEKLDIEMNVEKIREYKTAGDMLANKSMTAAHREMADSLLDSINQQFIAGIAAARGLDEAAVQAVVNQCPIEPAAFAATRLSDGVKFLDEIRHDLVGAAGKFLTAQEYRPAGRSAPGFDWRPKLAVIYAVGPIHTGAAGGGVADDSVGADTLAEAFEQASSDSDIGAIVFRIDSPGGSALASDLIWRAAQRAKAKKPVMVSMSDVAGSGGYYIAAAGTRIVAQPGSLTGSIGVVLAKPNIRGFLGKLGITTETLTRGRFARLDDMTSSASPEERAKVVAAMEHIYDVFLARVSEGRLLTRERVNELGRGRVWTGSQAKDNGLIDELGGFMRAIELAKEAAGIAPAQEVRLQFYPRPKNTIARLAGYLEARAALPMPPAWQRVAAVLLPLSFPDEAILALMAEVVEIR